MATKSTNNFEEIEFNSELLDQSTNSKDIDHDEKKLPVTKLTMSKEKIEIQTTIIARHINFFESNIQSLLIFAISNCIAEIVPTKHPPTIIENSLRGQIKSDVNETLENLPLLY